MGTVGWAVLGETEIGTKNMWGWRSDARVLVSLSHLCWVIGPE